jgi:hypothetical protein
MTLYDKILKIQYDNNINTTEFMDITGFSSTLYYAIKNGDKKKLKPLHAKILCDKFGISDSEWFYDNHKNDKKEIKKDNYNKNILIVDSANITDEDVEVEFVKRFSRLRNRPIIKMVIDSQIEVEVSKRLIKMSETGELKKWLDT